MASWIQAILGKNIIFIEGQWMFNPDLVCVWPDTIDYPLFRQFLHKNRDRFHTVIIIFSPTNWGLEDQKNFIKEKLSVDKITFLDSELVTGDWRNVAIKQALKESKNEWIWFVEQDFFPNENFWKEVEDLSKRTQVFGWYQEDRLHPCCLFIKRELLNKTSQDFSAKPPLYDHFGKIQRDLESKDILIGVIPHRLGYHMNGLTHNLYLYKTGQEPNYYPEEFFEYLKAMKEI